MSKHKICNDFNSTPYGAIYNRNLLFQNAKINQQSVPTISLKNIIDPRLCSKPIHNKHNSFGNIWYPTMYIDLNYNSSNGGYTNANGPIGPYFAQGLGNYPRSMFKEVKYGKSKKSTKSVKSVKKTKSPTKKSTKSVKKTKSPTKKTKSSKSNKIVYCLPKQKKFPVNSKKRCSAALSYARHADKPCKIAQCVTKHCKKYSTVGKYSKLVKECKVKSKK